MAFRSDSKPGEEQITSEQIRKVKDVSEWFEKIQTIPEPVNAIFKTYSGLSPEQIIPHIENVVSIFFSLSTLPSTEHLVVANQ